MPYKRVAGKANWNVVPERFSFTEDEGEAPFHPFFDFASFEDEKGVSVSVFPVELEKSQFRYGFDIRSGKRFVKEKYCGQKDVWKKFDDLIWFPPYTRTILPRVLDQLGLPQEVLVFGGKNDFEESISSGNESVRVRIIGGVIEQFCNRYPCQNNSLWDSRLKLIAVNPNDPMLSKVKTIAELKKTGVVDWAYVKAFIENGQGVTVSQKRSFPTYRVISDLDAKEALSYTLKKGHVFGYRKLVSMRKSCHKLYDHIWSSIERIRKVKELRDKEFRAGKTIVSNTDSRSWKEKILIRQKKQKDYLGFYDFFYKFHSKYSRQYGICSRYVRATNVNHRIDRHWFFAYLDAFFHLESLGYIFQCSVKAWATNPWTSQESKMYDPKNVYRLCTDSDWDIAFESAIITLTGLKLANQPHHRYIEYDSVFGGSHQKIYNWINDNGKKLHCTEETRTVSTDSKDSNPFFPVDVKWKKFGQERARRRDAIIR